MVKGCVSQRLQPRRHSIIMTFLFHPPWWLCAQHFLHSPRGVTAWGLTLCHLLFL